jgi:hypothetical protein
VETGALPSPLNQFAAQLDELRAGGAPDMGAIGRLLTELAGERPMSGFIPCRATNANNTRIYRGVFSFACKENRRIRGFSFAIMKRSPRRAAGRGPGRSQRYGYR